MEISQRLACVFQNSHTLVPLKDCINLQGDSNPYSIIMYLKNHTHIMLYLMKIVVQATMGYELVYQSCNPMGTKAHKFHQVWMSEPII